MISLASSGPPPNLDGARQTEIKPHFWWAQVRICGRRPHLQVNKSDKLLFRLSGEAAAAAGSSPLHWVFLEKAREEGAGLGAQRAGEADVFHED